MSLNIKELSRGSKAIAGQQWIAIENSAAAAPDITFTAAQSSQTTPAGGSAQFTLSVAALNGFGGVVTFSASSVPAGTVAVPSTAAVGSYTVTVTAASAWVSTKQITLTV
ncbi:MAG: hypothetical protein HY235_20995 [Acidobacteria bacterium]|nr:hypothetical protein [Acidobacteriota bacterium]